MPLSKERAKKSWDKWYADPANRAKHLARVRKVNLAYYEWAATLKVGRRCARCVEDDPVCLDFHHTDPKTKVAAVSHMVAKQFAKAGILAEIEKCIVLCANCHRKEHAAQAEKAKAPAL